MSPEVESGARRTSSGTERGQRGGRYRLIPHRTLRVGGSDVQEGWTFERRRRDGWAVATLNVSVAILLLLLCAPLMVIVAALVRLTSHGPALYSQIRVGVDRRGESASPAFRRRVDLGGRPILIYKFRTMYVEPGRSPQVWTRPNDGRVTRIGRWLRAFRIDELPQLVSVLRREMNVVGPRPEQPEIFAQLRERYERFPDRQKVLPGITGLAQVECGYAGDDFQMRRKLECDLEYVERRGLATDLGILLRTVPVVVARRGAR